MKKMIYAIIPLWFLCSVVVYAQEKTPPGPFDVLTPEFGYTGNAVLQFRDYLWLEILNAKVEWTQRFESVKTMEQAKKYQQERIEAFRAALGQFPERTPLNPRITKTYQKEGYRIEMIVLETQPNFYLTGALFLPDDPKWKQPYPAMLVLCGHSDQGKGSDYSRTCAFAALNGIAAFVIDPIEQGERHQLLKKDGKPYALLTDAHNLSDVASIAVGRSSAHYMIWDMIRALDYMESRPDIDAKRIGAAGNSGGGTQTSYIMTLDPRISVAAPSCYICSLYGELLRKMGPQDGEQNIFGQLGFYMDHADYVILRAPLPTLICTATRDMFPIEDSWHAYRAAQRFYDRFKAAEKVSLVETDATHGWSLGLREATIRWMTRWFYGRDVAIAEPVGLKGFSENEGYCLEEKEVLKLPGAKSIYDLNRDYEQKLKVQRQERWQNGLTNTLCDDIRRLTKVKPLAEIPVLTVINTKKSKITPFGIDCRMERFMMQTEPRVMLPIIRLVPTQHSTSAKPILVLHGKGKSAALTAQEGGAAVPGSAERFLKAGRTVVLADLRGLGETQFTGKAYINHKHHGTDGEMFYLSYLLGLTCVGQRTEDLLSIARWMKADAAQGVDIYTYGLPGTAAVHAAVLEPSLFDTLEVEGSLNSWSDIVDAGICYHPNADLVPGALTTYDIPNLVETLGAKLKFHNAINAQGNPSGTPRIILD